MRIIGGQFRGKRLQSPDDRSIRPTGDRVREALFNILEHHHPISGLRFLDLFCGTGAVGLEAYSRDAAEVWLMDQDLSLATTNFRAFNEPDNVRLCHQGRLSSTKPPLPFDIAFLDPPYRQALFVPALTQLRHGWLADHSQVVVELSIKEPFEIPDGFSLRQERKYGRVRLMFLELQ